MATGTREGALAAPGQNPARKQQIGGAEGDLAKQMTAYGR